MKKSVYTAKKISQKKMNALKAELRSACDKLLRKPNQSIRTIGKPRRHAAPPA